MQPLKPGKIDEILKERPDVTREHIREYERLAKGWLSVNPHRGHSDEERAHHVARIQQLEELHHKLFG